MPKQKVKLINLMPQDEFESSDLGRILKWALSTFRVMVIITELVVMSAFLSRFWLDAKNSDLNDEISVYKAQISAYSDIEARFRSLQERTSIIKAIYSGKTMTSIVTDITNTVPGSVSLTSISFSEGQVIIKATSTLEESIAEFLVNLANSKNLSEVNLTQVSSNIDGEAQTNFTVNAIVKGGEI